MKKVLRGFLAFAVLLNLLSFMPVYAEDDNIVFNNDFIKMYALSCCDADKNGEVSTAEAQKIEEFNFNYFGFTDISDLKYFTGLKRLYLSSNCIKDISALSDMTALEELYLDNNYMISDISSLAGLTSLKKLNLSCNAITDITPLANLTSLEELYFDSNDIRDISVLLRCNKLKVLYFYDNNNLCGADTKNAVYLGKISTEFSGEYDVWTNNFGSITTSTQLDELNLNGACVDIELNPFVDKLSFIDADLNKDNFILTNTPLNLKVDHVEYVDSKHARLYFSHDGSDIDGLKLTIKGAELIDNSFDLVFDSFPIEISDDKEMLVVKCDGEINAGQEDGEVLTVKIYNGNFADNINANNWTVKNLPDGVNKGTVERFDSKTVKITLNGNSSGVYDVYNSNISVSCTKEEYIDSTGGSELVAVLKLDIVEPILLKHEAIYDETDDVAKLNLNLDFDKPVNMSGGSIKIYKSSDDSLVDTIAFPNKNISGNNTSSIRISKEIALKSGSEYYVLIDETCFTDFYGNSFKGISKKGFYSFGTNIKFNNTVLEKALLSAGADIDKNGKVSIDEAVNIISLDLQLRELTDIDDLKYFTNIKKLNLSNNDISDIEALSNMKNLEFLNIQYNSVVNVTALSGLTNLKELDMYVNKIVDIQPLSSLLSLQKLEISCNNVIELTPLTNLKSLKTLNLFDNKVSDITPLTGLSIEELSVSSNNICDLYSLQHMTSLKKLSAENNHIHDITPLSELKGLEYLVLVENCIDDIDALKDLTMLTHLDLRNNSINDIASLGNLKMLDSLYLSNNKIKDIAVLQGFNALKILDIGLNNINDISPLTDLINLRCLYFYNNNVSDIKPLKGLVNLEILNIRDNKISDVSTLYGLSKIRSFFSSNNLINDLRPMINIYKTPDDSFNGFPIYPPVNNPIFNKDTVNSIDLGVLGLETSYRVFVPAGYVTASSKMIKSELDDASFDVEIYPTVFLDSSLDKANFVLENMPLGVSIEKVDYISENKCRIYLAYEGDDFSENFTELKLTIKGDEIVKTDKYGYTYNQLVIKDDMPDINAAFVPTVTTNINVADVTSKSAIVFGDVLDDGGKTVTERGFVFGTTLNPTISDSKVTTGAGIGLMNETLSGLMSKTTYHFRAYAVNSVGISYGNDVEFTTLRSTGKAITISGITINDKIYDKTAVAEILGAPALNGVEPGDDVSLAGTARAYFDNMNAGSDKTVIVSGYELTGKDASYYNLLQPEGFTANILAKPVTVSSITIKDKQFDGTSSADIDNILLLGIIGTDDVSIDKNSAHSVFDDENVGNGKEVYVSKLKLIGYDIGNYSLNSSAFTTTGNIIEIGTDPTPTPKPSPKPSTQLPADISVSGVPLKGVSQNGKSIFSDITVAILVDDDKKDDTAKAQVELIDERIIVTVAIDKQKAMDKIEKTEKTVTIPVSGKLDAFIGQLDGEVLKEIENKSAVLEIKTDNAAYFLPASEVEIDKLKEKFGENVALKDLLISVRIDESDETTVKFVESTAQKGNFDVILQPMEFKVTVAMGEKHIELSKFNSYIERRIAIPEGVDPNKITTGIVVESDGKTRHVPTKVTEINGKYYADINSLTNSTYSVVWHPLEFSDAKDHWAMDEINDMGSRMVVVGVGDDKYEPDRDITRAEFAAIVVKALGLKPTEGISSFDDVKTTDWYSQYIQTAYEYGIIIGYGEGKFGPTDSITREQAMAMVEKAMKITKLKVEFQSQEEDSILAEYVDSAQTSQWARQSIAACVKAQIVQGKNEKRMAPKDKITRAEVAVIIRGLLKKSNLI